MDYKGKMEQIGRICRETALDYRGREEINAVGVKDRKHEYMKSEFELYSSLITHLFTMTPYHIRNDLPLFQILMIDSLYNRMVNQRPLIKKTPGHRVRLSNDLSLTKVTMHIQ